jgi:signal transduction histidine kinase
MMVPMVYSGALVGYLAFETVQKPRRWVDHTIRLLKMIGEIFSNALERIDIETALVTAREQASEAARIKSAFLANMSHEIRTPLTSILGFASLLDEELADPEHLEYVHLIRQSGRRLMDTLNSVLDLAQLESHGRTISLGIFNITDQVNEVMRLLHPLASDKHLSLELVSKNPNALAEIDQACMHRILHNLIGNAIKFTDQGGVLVTVDADGKHVYVQVRDTGIGMNDTFLPEVFEEFKQESGGLTRSYEGNGLGLAITKRLVDLMGGTINVKIEKGRGSTFTVSLAQVNYETFHDPVDWDSDPMGVQKPRVLVVENNWETRMLLEHMLKSAYVVDTVGEAEEAIRKATRITFDIVLMDINLGGKQTGVDVLQVMRQLPGYDRTVIIALTAYALPGDKERFLELGFNGYLGKPFARTELLRSLEDLLASR